MKLARRKPRYGYRRPHALLSHRGHEANEKRVYRLYVEERLTARRKKRKRLAPDRAAEPRLTGAGQEWAMDFIADGLAAGAHPERGGRAYPRVPNAGGVRPSQPKMATPSQILSSLTPLP